MIYKQHAEGTVWKIPSYWPINGMLCYVMSCHVMFNFSNLKISLWQWQLQLKTPFVYNMTLSK